MKASIVMALLAAALTGCATRESANVYSHREAGHEQAVRSATVDSVRRVTIEGRETGIGSAAGGATGAIAGHSIGGGSGSAVAAILAGVGGGVAGRAIERSSTKKDAFEITVRLESGELRAIVQEADIELQPGDHVRLVTLGGVTRVTH